MTAALKEQHHPIEEGKADVLSLVMMYHLYQWEYVSERELRDLYVTSLVRLLYNSDARQAIMWLNYFKEQGAYSRDDHTGKYRIHLGYMHAAANDLAERLLHFQADGDYAGAKAFLDQYGEADADLQADNERIDAAHLPLGLAPIVEQGTDERTG